MKKIILTLVLAVLSSSLFAQSTVVDQIKAAFDAKQYDQIIAKHAAKAQDYPARAIYYIGLAYYRKSDDKNALKLMNLVIQKDKTNPEAYFTKGMALNYLKKPEEAVQAMNQAIKLDTSQSKYFSGLGDAYLIQGKYEKALDTYIIATQKQPPLERPFAIIPQLYAELKQPKKALQAFYVATDVLSKESDSYKLALYNIGLYEYIGKNYDKSEKAFKELVTLVPNDYPSHAKLIQVYYAQKDYDKAKPHKQTLYEAYEAGKLKDNLKRMFCFDQFEWKGKLVLAYEKFEEKKGELYYKHVFYVTNEEGKAEFTIQTENSPVSQELGGPKYAIGMTREGSHSTFGFLKEDFKYDQLKAIVMKILNKEVKPSARSKMGTKDR
ncbi:MAG TPA: hypothetical protein DCS93_18505 [Microscillaceae bacterium]|nr:hypothetical protein [Microscillaceae bacterium]